MKNIFDFPLASYSFTILAFIASIFPPFEWNYTKEGVTSSLRINANSVYYSFHSTPIKTYAFLFGSNQKTFYSQLEESDETYHRTLLFPELVAEYFLIMLIAIMSQLGFDFVKKRKQS